jgi:hypothetical protein
MNETYAYVLLFGVLFIYIGIPIYYIFDCCPRKSRDVNDNLLEQ